MASFSVGEALGSGFGLIKRYPLSVLMWGVAYFVISVLPVLLMWLVAGPQLMDFIGAAISAGPNHEPDIGLLTAMSSQLQLVQPVSILCTLLASGVLNAAIFRAVLEPSNRGFFFLRIGMDEFWQALVSLCVVILVFIATIAIALAAAAVGAVLYFALDAAGGGALHLVSIGVPVLLAIVAVIWVSLRFSLAAPATFATRSFQLFESWTLTKGHTGGLFGLALLLLLVFIALYIVAIVLFGIAAAATGVGIAMNEAALRSFFEQNPERILAAVAPMIVVISLVSMLISGAYYAVVIAPWASVYRQLVGDRTPAQD